MKPNGGHWPTKWRRPLRRATFGRAATMDQYLVAARFALRAHELAETDWLLHRRNCNPFRKKSPPWHVYEKTFRAEQLSNPNPGFPPIPDLPRARHRVE